MPPQQGDQCIFCQLISQPEQLNLVGETENFYAWLEVQPRAKGHAMVVPKEHKENVMEFTPQEWDEGMRLAREVAEKAEKALGADGASITINIKEAGGQMMPHAYIQVFPRFQEDENAGTPTGAIFPHREELQNELPEITSQMAEAEIEWGEEKIEPNPESQRFKQKETNKNEEENSENGKPEKRRPRKKESFEWV